MLQPPEGRRMDDPVAVALILGPGRAWPRAIESALRLLGITGVGRGIAHFDDKALFFIMLSYYF